jgi:plastocyanin
MGTTYPAMSVPFGGSIYVHNHDPFPHTLNLDAGNKQIGYVGAHGAANEEILVSVVGLAKGTHAIHCAIHSSMKGTITVT